MPLHPRLGLLLTRIALVLATIAALAFVPDARADRGHAGPDQTVLGLQWYDLTRATVAAAAQPEQVTQNRIWAVSWIAAARAVDAHGGPVFQSAAFATALHDALVGLVPAQAPQLDAALATTLAELPAGTAKTAGVAAGSHEAAAALAERAGDGLDTASINIAWTPPAAAPGVYQPTPPAFGPVVRAGLPDARAFLLHANDELRPGPPPSLDSSRYLAALAEVHAFGGATGGARTHTQTDTANFVAQSSLEQYVQVLRAAIADAHRPLAWQARLVAAFNAIQIDQQIAIADAKYTYVFWRPVTAIRTGTVDPDPAWTPLLASTPRHPEYPSGHAGYAGTAEAVLGALVGPRPVKPISVTSATAPGVVRTYADWAQITQDVVDGRVWEGVHFRFSDETALEVGKAVARHDLPPRAARLVATGGGPSRVACEHRAMVRPADPARDAAACAAIYAPYVRESAVSFEEEIPTVEEFAARIARTAATHPWLVCERDGAVAGFAYGARHRERAAYRWSADVSVYVDPAHRRRGIGRELYEALLAQLRAQRFQVACAGITLPNVASVGLHQSFGFEPVGIYRGIGWKAGAWRDVGWWQLRLLPPADDDRPPPEPLSPDGGGAGDPT
jgi:L-amino acid N-acyltransferase YncA